MEALSDENLSDEESSSHRRDSFAMGAPRPYPMSQQSQTPPPFGQQQNSPGGTSSSASSSSNHKPRRTIVQLNLSSQSDDDDDGDEGENAFASLESFLEGKFEGNTDEAKLDANSVRKNPSAAFQQKEKQNNHNAPVQNRGILERKSTTESSTATDQANPPEPTRPAPTVAMTDRKPDSRAENGATKNSETSSKVSPESNQRNDDKEDFVQQDDSPELSQKSFRSNRKRTHRQANDTAWNPSRFGGTTNRSTSFGPSSLSQHTADPDQSNRLLARNRRAAEKLQQLQEEQQTSLNTTASSRKKQLMPPPTQSKTSRVVPSTSSLVGSIPQRWMQASAALVAPSAARQRVRKRDTPSSAPTPDPSTNRTVRQMLPPTIAQSVPAWRTQSSKPLHKALPTSSTNQQSSKSPPAKKTNSFRPFGAAILASLKSPPPSIDDVITDVPESTTTDHSSPEDNSLQQPMWWMAAASSSSSTNRHSPRSPRKPSATAKRGALVNAFKMAKDKWQSDRLRLHNGGQTSSSSAAVLSSFSMVSNPIDDPRRKAKCYTDVTILVPGRVGNGGYSVNLVFLHEHNVGNDTRVEKQLAWCHFQNGQQAGHALRIYNAVILPWSSSTPANGQEGEGKRPNASWVVTATQTYEVCPRAADLQSPADILKGYDNQTASNSV